MFTIINSIKNIYRYKNKYILTGIIFFIIIIIAATMTGILIYSKKTTELLKMEYAGTVKISKTSDVIEDMKNFKKEDYLLFESNKYVENIRFTNYIISSALMGHVNYDITEEHERFYSKEDLKELENLNPEIVELELSLNQEKHKLKNLYPNSVYIMGYEYNDLSEEKKSNFIIEKGRIFENNNECVIALNNKIKDEEWNLLDIGDIITIKILGNINKEYTITGILKVNENITEDTKTRVLFTTFDSAAEFNNAINTGATFTIGPVNNPIEPDIGMQNSALNMAIEKYEVLIDLKSYEYFLDFQKSVNDQNGYIITPLYENFRTILNILDQFYYWSILFIIITVLIIIFMTIVTTITQLNSRKYEIAVLCSVGIKKIKLILSYLIENLVFIWSVTAVALTAAQFIVPIFTKYIFKNIQDLVSTEMLDILANVSDFELLLQNIGLIFGVMSVVVIFSLILTCINIVRFQPLKIFNKQY